MEWPWADVLEPHQMKHLDNIIALEDLRLDYPIVWMVLTGHSDSRDIAAKLGWPHELVMVELRRHKKDRLLIDVQGQSKMLWQVWADVTNEELLGLDRWRREESRRGGLFRPTENGDDA